MAIFFNMAKLAKVYHPQYLLHDMGSFHPESPQRLSAILDRLKETDLLKQIQDIKVRKATFEELNAVHTREHILKVAQTAEKSGVYLDPDTLAGPETYEVALLAAGGLLQAVDAVMDSEYDQALALLRPPGHHAESDHAMGFCFFNNIGVAAEYLIQKYHLKKVAIVDFDVHHGNASQHMFYDRDDIFFVSTHRYPFYPGTGAADERGKGAGSGYTLNLPMLVSSTDLDYQKVFEEKLIPALKEFNPEFLLVSAGFDAHEWDPLGGMKVTAQGFAWMVEVLQKVAQDCCAGKVVYSLEGGYHLKGLALSVEQVVRVLLNH